MSDIDGYEVCRRLKSDSLTRNIPIIMFNSANMDTEVRSKGLECGADAFLGKPLEKSELSSQIKAMLRIKTAEDILPKEKSSLEEMVTESFYDLLANEARYRGIFESTMDGVAVYKVVDNGENFVFLDFNNILQSIMLYTELVLLELDPKGTAFYRINDIFKASKRATDLVKQILLFSRQSEVELKPLQINLIVKEAVKMLRSSLPTTIEIKQEISQGWDLVMADPTRLQQIILNLATNAAHAMREKGGTMKFVLKSEDITQDQAA